VHREITAMATDSGHDMYTRRGRAPAPSFIVHSGYGLHAVWLLREPSRDKARWRAIQRAIVRDVIGAHVAVARPLDEYRILQGRALRLASSLS
jgi:hypothetical protein